MKLVVRLFCFNNVSHSSCQKMMLKWTSSILSSLIREKLGRTIHQNSQLSQKSYRAKREFSKRSYWILFTGMSSNSNHVKSAIKNLPEAFRSASSSIDQTSEESRRVSLRDTSYGMFYAAGWNGTWISGKEFMYSASDQSLNIYNMQANNSTQIFSADKMRTFAPYQTQLSSDKKYLLLKTSNYKVFRRSTYGTYDIISLENHTMDHLHPSNWSSKDSKFLIRYVSWAPQGNGLVYVDFNNNVSDFLKMWVALLPNSFFFLLLFLENSHFSIEIGMLRCLLAWA